jgi:hypothetical protein
MTCDFETFEGQWRFFNQIRRIKMVGGSDENVEDLIRNRKEEIRKKYHVPTPPLWLRLQIIADMEKEGLKFQGKHSTWEDQFLRYWRKNHRKYPTPAEFRKQQIHRELEEEAKNRSEQMRREEAEARKGRGVRCVGQSGDRAESPQQRTKVIFKSSSWFCAVKYVLTTNNGIFCMQERSVTSKDAPVPPALPVPNCHCGKPAHVKQSRAEDTAARAFYRCSDTRVSWRKHNELNYLVRAFEKTCAFCNMSVSCRTTTGASSSSGSMAQTRWIHGTC